MGHRLGTLQKSLCQGDMKGKERKEGRKGRRGGKERRERRAGEEGEVFGSGIFEDIRC